MANTISFGQGGYQGCRGGNGSDWYVENVLELLDSAREFHYDRAAHTLYLQPNATQGVAPSAADLGGAAVPALQTLLSVNASQAKPVVGLRFEGLGFRDAAPTYMEPHGVPSGGDWALERRGALFFEGTEGLVIDGCSFERNDGNALILSGYHRNASVKNNNFAWTGGTAVAAWGRTDELSEQGEGASRSLHVLRVSTMFAMPMLDAWCKHVFVRACMRACVRMCCRCHLANCFCCRA